MLRSIGTTTASRWTEDMMAMVALPPIAPTTGIRTRIRLGHDYFVRIAGKDYSIEPRMMGRFVDVVATLGHCHRDPRAALGQRADHHRSRPRRHSEGSAGTVPHDPRPTPQSRPDWPADPDPHRRPCRRPTGTARQRRTVRRRLPPASRAHRRDDHDQPAPRCPQRSLPDVGVDDAHHRTRLGRHRHPGA